MRHEKGKVKSLGVNVLKSSEIICVSLKYQMDSN